MIQDKEDESCPKEELQNHNPEQAEEMKLKGKYPHLGGGSHFLQKRLQQNKKYFDSGDYNMAKAKGLLKLPVLAQKQPESAVESEKVAADEEPSDLEAETGTQIPTPQCVPHRKTSLIPDVGSKLSPHPGLVHHSAGSPVSPVADHRSFV